MSTDTRTTTGWMPTESAITRGWMMFMTTNQPTTMMTRIGQHLGAGVKAATTTGGAHDTNGPKNGIIWRMATMTAVAGQYGMFSSQPPTAATRPSTTPWMAWPRRNPPNEDETLVWSSRTSSA